VTGTVAELLTLPLDPGTTAEDAAPGRETLEVRQWLDRARAGDEAAFGCLVDTYQRVAVRAAMAALGRREDAEDVAQEAFLLAWRKLAGFRGDSSFRTWLLTIVWRKALDRRRSRLLWWRLAAPHGDDAPFDAVAVSAATPERLTVGRDEVARVRREIARLSPTLRDTLLLAASGEHTYEQIAQMLGAPIGTIKWRVAEARRRVSERLSS
jgi:RNA polymerase sigma-70 factor (ECF subfamily)